MLTSVVRKHIVGKVNLAAGTFNLSENLGDTTGKRHLESRIKTSLLMSVGKFAKYTSNQRKLKLLQKIKRKYILHIHKIHLFQSNVKTFTGNLRQTPTQQDLRVRDNIYEVQWLNNRTSVETQVNKTAAVCEDSLI